MKVSNTGLGLLLTVFMCAPAAFAQKTLLQTATTGEATNEIAARQPGSVTEDRAAPTDLTQLDTNKFWELGPLTKATSCEQVEAWITDAVVLELLRQHYAPPPPVTAVWDPPSLDFSCTNWTKIPNIQHPKEGVETIDLVKRLGDYIFFAHHSGLSVLSFTPPDSLKQVDESTPLGYVPVGLLLWYDYLVVFWVSGYDFHTTLVKILDVSNPRNLVSVRSYELSGSLVDARVINGHLFFNMRSSDAPRNVEELFDLDGVELPELSDAASSTESKAVLARARHILTPVVRPVVEDLTVESFLPTVRLQTLPSTSDGDGPLLGCSDMFLPEGYPTPGVHSIVHIDLTDGLTEDTDLDAVGVLGEPWILNDLYFSRHPNAVVGRTWSVNYDVGSMVMTREHSAWWQWDRGFDLPPLSTDVHRFKLDMEEAPFTKYSASTVVPGWSLHGTWFDWPIPLPINRINQNSIEVLGEYTRITTNNTEPTARPFVDDHETSTQVFTLWDNGRGKLAQIGLFDQRSNGSGFRSITPFGDLAFLFKSTGYPDFSSTLQMLDLSDLAGAKKLARLEMKPNYKLPFLQPLGNDLLLAVYQEESDEYSHWVPAAHVFRILGTADPELVHFELIPDGDVHRDGSGYIFQNDTLVVPTWGRNALEVLGVDPISGIESFGVVDHTSFDTTPWCSDGPPIMRTVFTGDMLITLSDFGAKLSKVTAPGETLASVVFPSPPCGTQCP